MELFQEVAAPVPAYRKFLRERGIDPEDIRTLDDFHRLPLLDKDSYHLLDKDSYHRRYPLPELCRDGRLDGCDMIAVSSGSSGTPTIWPRSLTDQLQIARRFEQVFRDGFQAGSRSTLAVVCFPLGTWVGGLFTTACVRHLAAKGYPITVVAPGNNKAEILRVLPELAPHFDQVVLLGYPPFVKDVVDSGLAAGVEWARHSVKLVLAGEVFSEEWRDLMAERAGMSDFVRDSVSLYGTAGGSRLPTLVHYDPASRYLESHEQTLLFSGENGIPADPLSHHR